MSRGMVGADWADGGRWGLGGVSNQFKTCGHVIVCMSTPPSCLGLARLIQRTHLYHINLIHNPNRARAAAAPLVRVGVPAIGHLIITLHVHTYDMLHMHTSIPPLTRLTPRPPSIHPYTQQPPPPPTHRRRRPRLPPPPRPPPPGGRKRRTARGTGAAAGGGGPRATGPTRRGWTCCGKGTLARRAAPPSACTRTASLTSSTWVTPRYVCAYVGGLGYY